MREIRFLKTFGVDVVSFPIWDLEALPVLDDPDVAAVMSLHTTYGLAKPYKLEWNLRPVFGRKVVDRVIAAERRALERAPKLLANSRTVVGEIEESYGLSLEGRYGIVPHGTTDLVAEAGMDIEQRHAGRQSQGPLRVFVPARLEKRKGYDLAIRLAASLAGDPRIHFEFAGDEIDDEVRERALIETGVTIDRLPNARSLASWPAPNSKAGSLPATWC